jgi:hypothetical protein
MTMLGRAYAWALRRVFAFALRRALGEALLDLDADQLDVALRSGTFEIRDAALRGSYLRRKLGDVVPVSCREGRVARLRAVIPWHALGAEPIAVELESLDLVVGPNPDFFRAAKRADDKEDDPPNHLPPENKNENARPAADDPGGDARRGCAGCRAGGGARNDRSRRERPRALRGDENAGGGRDGERAGRASAV